MKLSYASIVPLFLLMIFLVPANAAAQATQDGEIPFFQTYQHESGIGYHIFEALNEDFREIVPPYYGFMAFSYGGRFTAKSFGSEAGVSLGFKGAVALSLSDLGSFFLFNLPITAEFNVGHAGTVQSLSSMGGFFGAGIDFNYINHRYFTGSPYFFGPMVTGGARFYLRNTSNTIRLSKTYDISPNGGVVLVFSLTTNIGE